MTRMRIFWSIYFILLGILLLLKMIFRWDFSIWTAAFALLFLESGVFTLTGGLGMNRRRHVSGGGRHFFLNGDLTVDADHPQADVFFSNVRIDLTSPLSRLTSVRCLFSSVIIRVPPDYSVRTVATTAFGEIIAPDGVLNGFGDRVFIIGDGLQSQMEVRCLFGQITILD